MTWHNQERRPVISAYQAVEVHKDNTVQPHQPMRSKLDGLAVAARPKSLPSLHAALPSASASGLASDAPSIWSAFDGGSPGAAPGPSSVAYGGGGRGGVVDATSRRVQRASQGVRTESSTASVPVEYQSDGGGGGGGEGGDLGVGAAASVRGGDGGSGGGGGVRGKARKGRAAAVDGPPKLCVPCMLEMKYGFDPVKGPTHKHFQEQVRTLNTHTTPRTATTVSGGSVYNTRRFCCRLTANAVPAPL